MIGPSGSGKSTLMNLIGCLDSPSKGEYWINGNLVSDMTDDELAHPKQRDRLFSRLSIFSPVLRRCTMLSFR
ncbi:MAG: ATP-binding cassette domain-containing protein [Chloracidobacterium sp.]|nr:ATP-binding cassette domain-containing protein [Chloracidobacterium sp.]